MTIYLTPATSTFDADSVRADDVDAVRIMEDFVSLAVAINKTMSFQLRNLVDWDYRQFRRLHDIFLETEKIRTDMETRFTDQVAAMARYRELAGEVERIHAKAEADDQRERISIHREWRLERAKSEDERELLRMEYAALDADTARQQPSSASNAAPGAPAPVPLPHDHRVLPSECEVLYKHRAGSRTEWGRSVHHAAYNVGYKLARQDLLKHLMGLRSRPEALLARLVYLSEHDSED